MATRKSQRIGIAVILGVTIIGTVGSFAVMILAQQNQAKDNAKLQAEETAYQAKVSDYTAQVNAQTDQLSNKYYPILSQYTSEVGSFNADAVTSLQTKDLLVGDGATIDGSTNFSAYYIGWMPDGKIFDESISSGKLKAPFSLSTGLDNESVIDGGKQGLKGMKVGGVRELTIPSDLAYKEAGTKDSNGKELIPPNTPLKFIVMAIPTPEQIPYPQMSEELLKAYYGG